MERLRALASWVTTSVITLGAAAGIVLSNISSTASTPVAQTAFNSPLKVPSAPRTHQQATGAPIRLANAPTIQVAALSIKKVRPAATLVTASTTVPAATTSTLTATTSTTSPPVTQPPTTLAPVVVRTLPTFVFTTTTVPWSEDGGGGDH
jgi:hypothetical protein